MYMVLLAPAAADGFWHWVAPRWWDMYRDFAAAWLEETLWP